MRIPSAQGWPMLEPRESVRTLPTYHPPLGGRDGLRLDFNENTADALRECWRDYAK